MNVNFGIGIVRGVRDILVKGYIWFWVGGVWIRFIVKEIR